MPLGTNTVCHMALVVRDIQKTTANWAKLLGIDPPEIMHIPPASEVPTYTHGRLLDQSDCRIALLRFDNLLLEFVEPGEGPSPFRERLEARGEGVHNISFVVEDIKAAYGELAALGAPGPYHVGYYPGGTYAFVDTLAQLGTEINLKQDVDNTAKIASLLADPAAPLGPGK